MSSVPFIVNIKHENVRYSKYCKIRRPVPFWKFQILGCWWWRELLSCEVFYFEIFIYRLRFCSVARRPPASEEGGKVALSQLPPFLGFEQKYFNGEFLEHWKIMCQFAEAVVSTSEEKKAPLYMERPQKEQYHLSILFLILLKYRYLISILPILLESPCNFICPPSVSYANYLPHTQTHILCMSIRIRCSPI